MDREDLNQKFEHLYKAVSSEKFLRMESLGGEIPFFISSYNPVSESEVCKAIKHLIKKLETSGIPVLEINLYDISMEILNKELGEDEIFNLEREMGKEEFKSALQSILDINQVLMPAIKQMIDKANVRVYFITGVGQVFPFIRSHNVLNNLQNIAKDAPTVMFFPGVYNGISLELFGLLKDDNYYRAFNIESYKL
ncbi:MAG: DUF1788 domain-containing protein [Bacteroidales bacterium]|nr:DUF1788 domain-containing protein [Bacteroidales bacterium]